MIDAKPFLPSKMSLKSDFLSWDELDLDCILEDFTEDDVDVDSDSSCDISDKKKGKCKLSSENKYQCPECQKSYCSISGFRGHMTKKHDKSYFRASRCQIKPQPEPSNTLSLESFTLKFIGLVNVVLGNILKDKLLSSPQSVHGEEIRELAKVISPYKSGLEWMIEPLYNIVFLSGTSSVSSSVDETILCSKFHKFRVRVNQGKEMEQFLENFSTKQYSAKFQQLFLRELLNELLTFRASLTERKIVECGQSLSGTERDIIQYIGGYVLKKFIRNKNITQQDKDVIRSKLIIREEEKENNWTAKVNRGGLTIINNATYGFFATVELETKKHVQPNELSAYSLKNDWLLELILESCLVKRAWNNIGCSGADTLCEKMIKLFLTVRGFALCKLYNRKALNDKKTNRKSLRKQLKRI